MQIISNHIFPKKTIKYDKTKPNGTPRKVLNISKAKSYGWVAKTSLKRLEVTYKNYILSRN